MFVFLCRPADALLSSEPGGGHGNLATHTEAQDCVFLSYVLCDACYFCFLFAMRFQLRTSPPRGTVGCVPPFHCVLVFAFLSRPTMVACGRALTLVSLVIASAFSFKSPFFVSPPPATPAVRGRFLTVVCLFIAFFSSRPLRHAGGTREVFEGGLPYCSVCVSFNYFSSRFPGFIAKAFRGVGVGFEESHLRLMF